MDLIAGQLNRNRTVICDINRHGRPEYAGRDTIGPQPGAQFLHVCFVKTFGFSRIAGTPEAGSVALACIGVEGELRNGQYLATDGLQVQVHSAGIIWENTEIHRARGKLDRIVLCIAIANADKDRVSMTDASRELAADAHLTSADSLDQDLQCSSTIMSRRHPQSSGQHL